MSMTNILKRLFKSDGVGDKLNPDLFKADAAKAAGPSEKYIDFSLPEKEGSYPAPADGWIALMAKPSGTNAVLQILVYPPNTVPDGSSYIWRDEYVSVNATQYAYLKTRVSKGQVVQFPVLSTPTATATRRSEVRDGRNQQDQSYQRRPDACWGAWRK